MSAKRNSVGLRTGALCALLVLLAAQPSPAQGRAPVTLRVDEGQVEFNHPEPAPG